MNSGFIDQVISIFNQSVVNKLMTLYNVYTKIQNWAFAAKK